MTEDPEYYHHIKSKAGKIAMKKSCMYRQSNPEKKVEDFLKKNGVDYTYSCVMGSSERSF